MNRRDFLRIAAIAAAAFTLDGPRIIAAAPRALGRPEPQLFSLPVDLSEMTAWRPHLFTAAREAILNGDLDVMTDDVYVRLIDSLDPRMSAGAVPLRNKTFRNGAFDADDMTFVAVQSDRSFNAVLLHTAKIPLALMPISDAEGSYIIANGGDIRVEWSNGPDRIISLLLR